jgi:hypothetical protein
MLSRISSYYISYSSFEIWLLKTLINVPSTPWKQLYFLLFFAWVLLAVKELLQLFFLKT